MISLKEMAQAMPRYVIQEHNASHLHWDLRLEAMDSEGKKVLFSWAVPKGVPEEVGVKCLAIRVEDHSLSWAKFSGTIPKGEYGAGTVKIFDTGHYLPIKITKDKMTFQILGKRLKGIWKLVKMKANNEKENKWILERVE
jgi:bifunctional non-homologous end joining protein LigD